MSDNRLARNIPTLLATTAISGAGLQPASAYPRPGRTEMVSVASDESPAEYGRHLSDQSADPDITPSGRYVAFMSTATNLDTQDRNIHADVFIRDRKSGKTELVSL